MSESTQTDPEGSGSVQEIRKVKVHNIVSSDDVRVHLLDEFTPGLEGGREEGGREGERERGREGRREGGRKEGEGGREEGRGGRKGGRKEGEGGREGGRGGEEYKESLQQLATRTPTHLQQILFPPEAEHFTADDRRTGAEGEDVAYEGDLLSLKDDHIGHLDDWIPGAEKPSPTARQYSCVTCTRCIPQVKRLAQSHRLHAILVA